MSKKLTERFEMRLSVEEVTTLDDWRRHQPDLPSRAEAIRRLIDRGLTFDYVEHALLRLVSLLRVYEQALTWPAKREIADILEPLLTITEVGGILTDRAIQALIKGDPTLAFQEIAAAMEPRPEPDPGPAPRR